MTDWIRLVGAALMLAGAVCFFVAARVTTSRLRRVRDVSRVARYQLARELRLAGHVDAAHVALTIAEQIDAALAGRL